MIKKPGDKDRDRINGNHTKLITNFYRFSAKNNETETHTN